MSIAAAPFRRSPSADVPSEATSTLPAGPARMAIGGRIVPGRVLAPNVEIGFVAFVPANPDTAAPAEGENVRLSFGKGGQFSARSEVVDADGGHWFLTLPTDLGPAAARRATRQPANGDWQFVTDDEDFTFESEVHDISPEGIGLLLAPHEPIGSAGRRIQGRLVRIDGPSIPVMAEVRNMRRHAHSPDWKVVGCALHLAATDRGSLAELIAQDA
mgnify:CR=1 FL=1|jgi:hypothetical protein